MMVKPKICSECGCDLKTKYVIRIDHDYQDPKKKQHFEATSKKSVVGWIKLIMNEYTKSKFEDITIYDLRQCHIKVKA